MARTHDRPAGRVDYVRNRSSRGASRPIRVVMHTTESHNRPGRGDVDAVHAWFDNPRSEASSHVIIDAEGHSTTCVPDGQKAWTQAAYNGTSLSIENIGTAAGHEWTTTGLKKAAKFTAYWCDKYGIPAKRVRSGDDPGICGHIDLGAAGGGHVDPGPNFPWRRFITYVRYYQRYGWKN